MPQKANKNNVHTASHKCADAGGLSSLGTEQVVEGVWEEGLSRTPEGGKGIKVSSWEMLWVQRTAGEGEKGRAGERLLWG